VAALLRVMVLRGAPPDHLAWQNARVMQEGARLRGGLPTYLARRRPLLDEQIPTDCTALGHGGRRSTTTRQTTPTRRYLGQHAPFKLPTPET
jgi:hypothetical protein